MINNLFSIFDPSTNLFSINWIAFLLPLFFFTKTYFISKSRIFYIFNKINFFIQKDLQVNLKKNHIKIIIILMIIFNIIYFINLLRLLPFIFTPTRHISTTLLLSLPIWAALTLKTIFINTGQFFSHLVPIRTPTILIPFIVIIETIRILIRPLTLIIRLTANIIAGHVLICLLRQILNINIFTFLSTSLILNILILLEISVAVIQGYVFTILLSLYLEETC